MTHWSTLRYPRVDAISVKRDLEDIYGFQVELIQNPTKADILHELHKYAQKEYTPEDQLLIFFAGHGDFDTVTNMGYLVSQDTKKPEDDPSIRDELLLPLLFPRSYRQNVV